MAEKNKNIRVQQSGKRFFIYDSALIEDPATLFDYANSHSQENTAKGRGSAVYLTYNELRLVFKHYQRGGFVAKIMHDQYFGVTVEATRAFREWRLLNQMRELNLPVPVPVAARVLKSGFLYKADMLMREIENTQTLADLCLVSDVSDEIWKNVGQCIKQFHHNNVYHADLNARNILIGQDSAVYLIDFDKGFIRELGDSWKISNLSRLNRSLEKFKTLNTVFHYTSANWDLLLDGYNQ